ncbi:MAG: malonyl-CoA decarboxylase [Dongiaceae bacterium]
MTVQDTRRPGGVNQFLNAIADAGLDALRAIRGVRTAERDVVVLGEELLSTRGEASGTAVAREMVTHYRELDADGRRRFFETLATDFDVDPDRILAAAKAYGEQPTLETRLALARAAEAPRQKLFRRIHTAPDGGATLVRMREDLLQLLPANPALEAVDADLRYLLKVWFNRGFLALERIDWNTPAAILERLIRYESVHEVRGWDDLRRRLAADRRCFAFFHPALPGDPVIFVEVALVHDLADSIGPLLDRDGPVLDPSLANTAIFYSINNCHDGLRGITFGNFLIKQVVVELQRELPAIERFATLSPVPGFRRWLARALERLAEPLVSDADQAAIRGLLAGPVTPAAILPLEEPIMRLAAHYLLNEKREQEPLDPVARFHLRNGARLERVNWLGDPSSRGLGDSFGIMVNYLYDPRSIEKNHEAYVSGQEVVAASRVTRLLPRELRG